MTASLSITYIRMSLSLRRNIIETWTNQGWRVEETSIVCWTKPWNVGGIHKSNHASNYCKVLKLIFSFTITCRPDFFLLNLAWLQFGWCSWNLPGESPFEILLHHLTLIEMLKRIFFIHGQYLIDHQNLGRVGVVTSFERRLDWCNSDQTGCAPHTKGDPSSLKHPDMA